VDQCFSLGGALVLTGVDGAVTQQGPQVWYCSSRHEQQMVEGLADVCGQVPMVLCLRRVLLQSVRRHQFRQVIHADRLRVWTGAGQQTQEDDNFDKSPKSEYSQRQMRMKTVSLDVNQTNNPQNEENAILTLDKDERRQMLFTLPAN